MSKRTLILLLALGAIGLIVYKKRIQSGTSIIGTQNIISKGYDMAKDTAQNTATKITSSLWQPPKAAEPYLKEIYATEVNWGLPHKLLARLLYQESRFNPDIISGKKKSSAGAIGIAQFMPATAKGFGLDPTDPIASIRTAGKYLAQLYKRFGNWTEALAAYNWGQGNVATKGIAKAPLETRNYYAQILSDVNVG